MRVPITGGAVAEPWRSARCVPRKRVAGNTLRSLLAIHNPRALFSSKAPWAGRFAITNHVRRRCGAADAVKHAGGVISRAKSGLQRLARRIALLVALTVAVLLALRALFRFDVSGATYGLIAWLRDDIAVSTGCAVLVIATAVATPLMLSTTPINIGAGAVYGVVLGTFVTLLGHVAGAWICYVWSRWWARDWISRKMRSSETLTALNHALAKGGAGIVMLSRLSPLFPFAMCSFCFGACNVGTWDYLMGTAVGLAPSTAMLAWVGVTIQSYSKKGASLEGHSAADYRRLWGVILLTVVSSVLLGWRVKAVIKAQAREAERSGLVVGTAGVGSTPG